MAGVPVLRELSPIGRVVSIAVAVTAIIAVIISQDGESNWL
jgi:hypothetical protein